MAERINGESGGLERTDSGRASNPSLPEGRSGLPAPDRSAYEVRRSTHTDLTALGLSLAAEFSGRVVAGTVIRSVAQARERLLAAGVRFGLVAAVESMSRTRLGQLSPSPPSADGTAAATSDEATLVAMLAQGSD